MLVLGDREQEAGAASLRLRTEEDLGAKPIGEIIDLVRRMIDTKSLALT
jgi:threonyl-tRNA synthetase